MAAAHRRFGTTSLLPTLITDRPEKLERGIAAVREAMRTNPSVLGIHLEGPFISARRPGVHDPAAIRRPTDADLALLTSLEAGVTLVTLAPEEVPAGFIAALVGAGVRVSLGHSMATYDETRAAMAEGLTGFTHLFNAMRPLGSRDPGPIAAALEAPDCFYGLIVDGEHVHPAMLKLALRARRRHAGRRGARHGRRRPQLHPPPRPAAPARAAHGLLRAGGVPWAVRQARPACSGPSRRFGGFCSGR